MAETGPGVDQDSFLCVICLDLLKDPVTVPCGHSYCSGCINEHWDEESVRMRFSCPQCRQSFRTRPVLGRNTMLAALVEQLKKTGLQAAAAAGPCYAAAGDVSCDVCTGRKLKALKSCLVCLASYCENHLQFHHEAPRFKKHQLVEPSEKLQENICSQHDEVMKMFCRTDQQIICYLCSVDQHKGHDTVSAAAERSERQKELEGSRQNIQQGIQDREEDLKLLQQQLEALSRSADKAVDDSEEIFTQLIRLLQKTSCELKQQIRSQQQTEVSGLQDVEEKLQQEIRELKRKDAELKLLSHTEDHNQFLHNYPRTQLSGGTSSIQIPPLRRFEDVTAAVSELRDQLQDVLKDTWTNIDLAGHEGDVLQSEPEPRTRSGFLRYARDLTLDPNTAHPQLLLSAGNSRAERTGPEQPHPSHRARFSGWRQVLSRQALTGRSYWELEWTGQGVCGAVAYGSISRAGDSDECGFGFNDRSWALYCDTYSYNFWFNNTSTPLSGPVSSRIGVFLDHRAGLLSFYSVSETMTLLHRVQTTFTQPLHAGLHLYCNSGDSAGFCPLR